MSFGIGLRIRPATLDDLEAVVALDRAAVLLPHWAAHEYLAAVEPAIDWPAQDGVHRRLSVAERASVLAGFAVVKIVRFEGEVMAELESIAVAAASQRSGIGRALLLEALEWARAQGATSMELEVRSRNDAAIALYAGLGFAAQSTRHRYYRDPPDDALLMRLDLL